MGLIDKENNQTYYTGRTIEAALAVSDIVN